MSNEELSREEQLWQRAKEFDGVARAESYHELSKIEYDRQNYKEALSMCMVAKDLYQADEINSHCTEIIDLNEGMSYIYEYLDECEKAEEALLEAVNLARDNESSMLGALLRSLGRLYFDHEKWDRSIECHTEAMELPEYAEVDRPSRGIDLLNIGMAFHRSDRFAEALNFESEALEIFEDENANAYWIVNTSGELSATYVGLNNGEKILEYGQRALDWFEMENNHQKVWVLRYYMAIGYRLLGDLEKAIWYLQSSRDLALEHHKRFQEFGVDLDKELGEIYIMQGKVEKGQELIRRAKSVEETLENEKKSH